MIGVLDLGIGLPENKVVGLPVKLGDNKIGIITDYCSFSGTAKISFDPNAGDEISKLIKQDKHSVGINYE